MKKKILICPLDWGIGHATRCMPLIRAFLSQSWEVIIAGSGQSFFLLKKEFPGLHFVSLPGFSIRYSKNHGMICTIVKQLPGLITGYLREKRLVRSIAKELAVDVVLSDNRYGVLSPDTLNIFLSHQLHPILPGWLNILNVPFRSFVHAFVHRFDLCWIPDWESEPNLSGLLSHPPGLRIPYRFIGPLSRFTGIPAEKESTTVSLLVLISGPEPQRTLLETKILKQLKEHSARTVVLLGVPISPAHYWLNEQVEVFSHLDSHQLLPLLSSAEMVISRPGYSSIMDYMALGKRAILIPTPGQTEQEYLAHRLQALGVCFSMPQEHFDLPTALKQGVSYRGFDGEWRGPELNHFVDEIEKLVLLKHQKHEQGCLPISPGMQIR